MLFQLYQKVSSNQKKFDNFLKDMSIRHEELRKLIDLQTTNDKNILEYYIILFNINKNKILKKYT